jgi:spore germination protein YaaH
MRRTPLLLTTALLAAVALAPPAALAAKASPCKGEQPTQLTFNRKLGKTVGMLRWQLHKGMRARVLRDGRVVGQTAKHALRIPVTLGHRHRFTIVALTAEGHPTRCKASKRVTVTYRMPSAPASLAVGGDERGLRLTWLPSQRGDGTLAGYRLLRNGAMLGQTGKTRWNLGAASNHAYRFTVVAVDSQGHTSPPSNTVTAVTGHEPPSAPDGLEAIPVSDSEIGAQWQPSTVGNGRIAGYRVLRDGVVVKQVTRTSLVLDNLAASTTYRLSVVAVDSLGYMSKPSAPADVRTQSPVPTTGNAQAYLLATTDQSFADFRAHYRNIGVVYPTYFDCTPGVDLEGRDDPLVTRWAQARQVRVLPRVNCQRTTVIHKILTDPPTRAHWLDLLMALVDDNGYDGISIDFEAGPATDRTALSTFIEELAARLHAQGKLLTIALSPKVKDIPNHSRSGIFDYPRLSQSADWLFVMAWGLHWSTSPPGSQDDVSWTSQIVAYVATMPLKHKFVYGTNLYAMDWPAGGGASHPATAYEYDDFVPRIPALGATTQLDAASDTWHATYTDGSGVAHDVWYPDGTSIGHRIGLAAQQGLGGVGFWRLGREDQRLWDDPLLAPGAAW